MLSFEYDPDADCPNWYKFVAEVFDRDGQQIEALQDWFGYVLTHATYLQKILFISGPPRSGKGTILRVLTQLLGEDSVCSPRSASVAENFGLQPLLGKKLATITDARFGSRNASVIVERLLSISGEDSVSIARKHSSSITKKLGTKFIIVSNELPRLKDASGALASRFLILRTPKSFLGKEDSKLFEKLKSELPGILIWSLMGLSRLERTRKIIQPEATADAQREILNLSSSVAAFVSECCEVGDDFREELDVLFETYKNWSEGNGTKPFSKNVFSRNLGSCVSRIDTKRVRLSGTASGTRVRVSFGIGLNDDWRPERNASVPDVSRICPGSKTDPGQQKTTLFTE
jgi:putative DNA primase/helicase